LHRRELVQVLPGWAMLDADVHLVLPPRNLRLATPRRMRLLQDHLVTAFAQVPWQASLDPQPIDALRAPPRPRQRR
jgi:LysR family transcriptional regulator, transcriptional activator for dmlA